jgi:integrase
MLARNCRLTFPDISPTLRGMNANSRNATRQDGNTFGTPAPYRDTAPRATTKPNVERVKVGNIRVAIYTRERTQTKNGVAYTGRAYEVADYSTGSRRLRSFADKGEARREAERIARLMASGESTAAQMRGGDAASYSRAIELLRPTGDALELVASRYAEAVAVLGNGSRLLDAVRFFVERDPSRLPQKTVAEVAEELIELRQKRGASASYLADLRNRLAKFAAAFQCQAAAVTGAEIQSWLDGLKVAPQTAKNFRTVAHTLFKFAETRGYIAKGQNPVAATEGVRVKNGDAVEIYTPGEIAKLLAAAPADLQPLLAIGAFAGVRVAEMLRLEWADIDLAGGFLTVSAEDAKTKSRRLVPLADNLRQWLAPYAGRSGKVWAASAILYHKRTAATSRAAGVPWKGNALRHSFASYRLAQTQSAAQVSLEMGNSPQVVFRHYRELVKPADAAAWFAVAPEQPANVVSLNQAAA